MSDLSACRFASRVFQSAPAPGRGRVVPDGANLCGQNFDQAFENGDPVYYSLHTCVSCEDERGDFGLYEVGCGTWDGTGLVRDENQIEASSNGGLLVNFSSGEVVLEATLNADFLRGLCSEIERLQTQLDCATPIGQILEWPWNQAPDAGWLRMDGVTQYDANTYADLVGVGDFAVSNGTFVIPNLFGGRSMVGSGAGQPNGTGAPPLTNRARGTLGGEEQTTLSAANIPEHFHFMFSDQGVAGGGIGPNDTVARSNLIANAFAYDMVASNTGAQPSVGRTGTAGNANAAAHNTMHPFYVVDYYLWSGVC